MKTVQSLLLVLSAIFGCSAAQPEIVNPYPSANTLRLLEKKKEEQIAAARSSKTFHEFTFEDRYEQSGIRFEQQPVDDASRTYMAVHYDHGTGLAAADIDNDGKLDLYFVNQLGGNQLWRNAGSGKFENITAGSGTGLNDKICVSASFGDIDNDGLPDLYVTTVKMGNHLFKNLGGGKFADITEAAGLKLSRPVHSSGAVFFDFNNDGLLDLFVTNVGVYTTNEKGRGGFFRGRIDAFFGWRYRNRSEQSILYQNLGNGKFEDVSQKMGLQHRGWSGDATFCDLNGDGFPDLYVLSMSGNDKYYENQQGKRFLDKTSEFFPKTPWGAMGVKFFDYNLDGLMDLYVTDMHSDMTGAQIKAGDNDFTAAFEKQKSDPWCALEWNEETQLAATNCLRGNAFFQNLGQGKFKEVSELLHAETYWPWGVSVADFNADGYEDIFVTAGMGYPLRYAVNSLLLNEKGERFLDSEFVVGVEPRKNNRVEKEFFQLDCSGADRKNAICRGKTGIVTVFGSTSSRSSIAFDIDDDGDIDLVTNEWSDHPQVLTSDLSSRKKINYLKVKLSGTKSNRDGLGATVTLRTKSATYTRSNDGKSGYLSQSVMPLYFGLGESTEVDSIEVRWPSGKKQLLSAGIQANTQITITEER